MVFYREVPEQVEDIFDLDIKYSSILYIILSSLISPRKAGWGGILFTRRFKGAMAHAKWSGRLPFQASTFYTLSLCPPPPYSPSTTAYIGGV